jgi:hypothetical protein
MDARAQDFFRFPHMRIGELRERKIGLHGASNVLPGGVAVIPSGDRGEAELSLDRHSAVTID